MRYSGIVNDTAAALATYADLEGLEEGVVAEVIAGVVRTAPSPLPEHGRAQRALGRFVGGPFDDDDGRGGPGGWWIVPEVDVRLGEHDIVRPDLTGWRRDRLADPWSKLPVDVRPDWVCEIISPSNAAHDRVTKRRLYARYGVPYYWIVDPSQRTLEALVLREGEWAELGSWGDGDTARIEPFAAVELEVERLFPPR